jgi:hypothetical protein
VLRSLHGLLLFIQAPTLADLLGDHGRWSGPSVARLRGMQLRANVQLLPSPASDSPSKTGRAAQVAVARSMCKQAQCCIIRSQLQHAMHFIQTIVRSSLLLLAS